MKNESPPGDQEPAPTQSSRRWYWLLLAIFSTGLLLIVLSSQTASAQAVAGTCSAVTDTVATGSRTWYFGSGDTAGVVCSTSTDTLHKLTAGSSSTCPSGATCSITLKCRETSSGLSPPPAASTLTLKVYADGASFGSPASGGQIWTATPTGNTCASEQSFTVWCTSDGTSTGTARHGTLRPVLRAQNSGAIPAYDVNTDSNGNWGIIRCNPRISAFTDGNPTSSPSLYVSGDPLRTSITTASTPYTGTLNVRIDIVCAAATNSPGSITLANGAVTIDATLKGSSATWPDDCTLAQHAVISATSTISGLTAQPLFEWDSASPPSGITYPTSSEADKATAKILDRTLSSSSCRLDIGSEVGVTIVGRGKALAARCTWVDARGTVVTNTGLGIAYTHRSSQALTDATDLASVNVAAGAAGLVTYAPSTTSTSTDTNSTAPLDYVESLEMYSASRTSAELLGYGTSAGVFDVSQYLDPVDIQMWRNVCNGAVPATAFWIDHEVVCSREGAVHDPRGNVVTTSLTFTRTYTNGASSIASDSESGVTSGTSAAHYTVPQAPAGTWTYSVTISDGLGNTGSRSEAVTFTTTQPADETTGTAAGGDDPLRVSAGYSWDTVRMSISATSSFTNGTRRQGVYDLFTVQVVAPDNTTAVTNLTMVEAPAGTYSGSFNPGIPPMLGTWNITASVWQADMVDRAVANIRLTIAVNASQKFADQYALTQAMWVASNQTSLDATTRLTYTNALLNASMVYTWSLENATKAQEMIDAAATQAAVAGVAAQTTGGFQAANASRIALDLARNLTEAANLATAIAEIDSTAAATQAGTAGGFLAANASRIASDLARNLSSASNKADILGATAGGFLAANASRDASDLARNLSAAANKADILAAVNARAGEGNATRIASDLARNLTEASNTASIIAQIDAKTADLVAQINGGFQAANASRIALDLARNLTEAQDLATTLARIDADAAAAQASTAGGFLTANASRIALDLARNLSAAADKTEILSGLNGGFLAANASRIALDLARNLTEAADKADVLSAINARAGEANASRIATNLARNLSAAADKAAIIAEVDAKAAEIEAQAASFAAADAARASYTNALLNLTSATQIAAESYTDTLLQQLLQDLASFRNHVDDRLNATDAAIANLGHNASSRHDVLGIHLDGDAGPQSYAGRATALNATILNGTGGSWGALLVTWDLGDHSTAIGPVVYHAYEKAGDYHVIARAVDALGTTSTASATVNVTASTPTVDIAGPANATQLFLATYDASGSSDAHDTITTYAWELDAGDVDIPMIGVQHYNKGYGSGSTFHTSFPTIGDHRLSLTVTNAHGGANTTTLLVHVGSPIIPTPGAPDLPAAGNPNNNIASGVSHTLGFFEWLARFVTGR